jgi:hypothetical protein
MITRHVLRATVEGETLDAIQPGIITLVGFASGVLADGGAPGSVHLFRVPILLCGRSMWYVAHTCDSIRLNGSSLWRW